MIIAFYQKFLTLFSFGSCRYHPTCSEYAKWEFENNNILKAFCNSLLRVLKCNQLFAGGFDYPKIRKKINNINFKKIDVKYWYIPISKNKYIIIKNWKFKNGTK
ncbi:Protein YidD [hydrothermal vent metagenome]|uniref:Protein YidD n=1 Tax=hydrothermal vent metagenome TaxID=652676 RepID=A0A3B1DYQ0_9ZZZZ